MVMKQKDTKTKSKKPSNKWVKSDSNVDIGKGIGGQEKENSSDDVREKVITKKTKIGNFVIRELPKVQDDAKLQKIAEDTNKVEKEVKNKKKKTKTKESKPEKESYLSVSSSAKDGQTPKVPSFSAAKNRGVVYISHIPHGFYEKQMREFFSQFGSVTNLRLGRSKKTGKSCGYAFVEFKYLEVATIVSESMNNYLMFDKILKCSVVPAEKCSPAMFRNKIKPNRPPGKEKRIKAKKLLNSVQDEASASKRQERQIEKMNSTLKKLKEAGIDYNFQIPELS